MCASYRRAYVARMKRFLPSTTAAALLAAALFVSATGGAVAGSMITGKQIKDGSVTGKDLKDKSLSATELSDATLSSLHGAAGPAGTPGAAGQAGAAGVSGYLVVTATDSATSNSEGMSATATCTGGRKPLGAVADFERRFADAPVLTPVGDNAIKAFGINDNGGPDTLTLTVFCALVS
jgi:hypothetical protein